MEEEEAEEEIKKRNKKELNELWEAKLKNKAIERINSIIDEAKIDLKKMIDNINYKKDNKSINIEKPNNDNNKLIKLNNFPLDVRGGQNDLINSVLISLSNIDLIRNFFYNDEKKEEILKKFEKKQISNFFCVFSKFIYELWTSYNDYYESKVIHAILKNLMNEIYNTEDLGLIFKFIISTLDKEIKGLNPISKKYSKINGDNSYMYDQEKARKIFEESHILGDNFISQFFSTLEKKERCPRNKDFIRYSYSHIPVVNLFIQYNQLEDEDDYIINSLDLKESFAVLLSRKDTNKVICNACKMEEDFYVSKKLIRVSKYLIININREKDKEHKITLNYDLTYNQFSDEEQNTNTEYQLICVIIKKYKEKLQTFCRNINDKKWYVYDQKKEGNVSIVNNLYEIIDTKFANILIYERVEKE